MLPGTAGPGIGKIPESRTYSRLPWTVRLFGNLPPELCTLISFRPPAVTWNELTELLPALTANSSFPFDV